MLTFTGAYYVLGIVSRDLLFLLYSFFSLTFFLVLNMVSAQYSIA